MGRLGCQFGIHIQRRLRPAARCYGRPCACSFSAPTPSHPNSSSAATAPPPPPPDVRLCPTPSSLARFAPALHVEGEEHSERTFTRAGLSGAPSRRRLHLYRSQRWAGAGGRTGVGRWARGGCTETPGATTTTTTSRSCQSVTPSSPSPPASLTDIEFTGLVATGVSDVI